MVDRVIKIQEQQLHNSCPVAEKIKYYQQLVQTRDEELAEYSRVVGVHLTKISDLESQIENLKERVNELEDLLRLISDTSDKLEDLLYGVRNF